MGYNGHFKKNEIRIVYSQRQKGALYVATVFPFAMHPNHVFNPRKSCFKDKVTSGHSC